MNRMRKMIKRVMCLNNFIIMVFLLAACSKVLTNVDEYSDYVDSIDNAESFMPSLSELPEYLSIEVYYYEHLGQSINLLITFSDGNYESAKEAIFNSFVFLKQPLMQDDFYLIPEVEFEYNVYIIKVVDSVDFKYPEQFGMLGYSDEKHQILFMFFYDESLNRISNSKDGMIRFVESEFKFPED